MKTIGDRLDDLENKVEQYETVIDKLERRLFDLEQMVGTWPPKIPEPPVDLGNACQVCSIEWSGAMGYCCTRSDCPFAGSTSIGFPLGLNTGG